MPDVASTRGQWLKTSTKTITETPELLALALSTLTVSKTGEYASITVTLDMYQKTGASELTDGFATNYPCSIHGVGGIRLFREITQGVFKISFRSKEKINVSIPRYGLYGEGTITLQDSHFPAPWMR
ncbi:MAG: hypothetical protein MZV70_73575 [Desulfobacterales bacterium]|nr:hypothetical protein [Desulfobacterales bacterium]